MVKCVTHALAVTNYSVQIKFKGKIFSWVQLTHKNITQRINFTTKSSQEYISQTMVCNETLFDLLQKYLKFYRMVKELKQYDVMNKHHSFQLN